MDRLLAMQVFARVVELGSFSRAAEALELSRARVSELVQELEAELGARLLHRTTRRIALTDDGRAYHARVSRILSDVAEAEAEVVRSRSRARGRLRVGTPFALGRLFLLPRIPSLLRQHDGLELSLVFDNRSIDLAREGLDCAISYGPPRDLELVAKRLGSTTLVTCASASYLERHGRPERLEALARHETISFLSVATTQPTPWLFSEAGGARSLSVPSRLCLNSMEACVDAAAAGFGITQVLSSVALRALREGRLEPVLLAWSSPGPDLFLAYPPNRQASARMRVFSALAERVFGEIESDYRALAKSFRDAPDARPRHRRLKPARASAKHE